MNTSNTQVETLTLGQLQTNCYIPWCKKTRECIVIDPADDAEYITQKILELDLNPLCIVFSHGHFDHVLGSLELKLNFDIPIFMHKNDNQLLKTAQSSAKYWLKHDVDPVPNNTAPISEDTQFKFGNSVLSVIETPGHTLGSISLFADESQPKLFTGDTLFKSGVGRTDFEYSSPQSLQKSIKKLFKTLPPETICFPGHGEATTLSNENTSYL